MIISFLFYFVAAKLFFINFFCVYKMNPPPRALLLLSRLDLCLGHLNSSKMKNTGNAEAKNRNATNLNDSFLLFDRRSELQIGKGKKKQ